ncbi:PAS domain-containing protein [Natrinema sp. 1APR25-10V2]|uniref:PAS domain-containing protein n=1 Tax=Natrinema sp. 1APR25-10V2 TaxID=2951081 RepID=UPI00287BB776|nr:PAS domain-containing protein [Natrinema sp. 1APR25-10V2]
MTSRSLTDSLRETLRLFDGSGTPRTTTEIAERLDLGRRSTYERLERLVDHGELETKKVGASGRVWWRPQSATVDRAVDAGAGQSVAESLIDDVLDDAEVAVFVLDEDFEVAWLNDATERYLGLERERVLGRDKRRLVRDRIAPMIADGDSFADTVLATYEENTYPERFECRVTPDEGREGRWLEHRSEPIESGAYAGGRVELYYDITDQKRTERARREDRTKFESLVDAVEEYAIFMLDADGRVRSWNAGAERIKGYATEEVLGEHVSTFYTADDRQAGVPESNLAAAAEEGSIEDEGWRVRADGSRFWASVTITAVRDDGDLEGYAKVTRDMTERKRAREEQQLQLSVNRSIAEATSLEKGLQSAMEHVCEWTDWEVGQAWTPTEDGTAERLSSSYAESDAFTRFNEVSTDFTFGPGEGIPGRVLESGEPVWYSDVSEISEEEYHRASLAAEAGVKAGLGVPVLVDGEVGVILEFYMSHARRRDDWMVQVVTSTAAELGSLVTRKQAEDELEHQRDLMENVLETSPVGIAVLDDQGSIRRANSRAEELLGLTGSGIEGRTYDDPEWDIWDEDGVPIGPDEHPVTEVLETGEPVFGFRHGITLSDGTDRWLSSNSSPVIDETGEVQQVVVALEDITQIKEQAHQLERQRDDLERELEDVFERIDDAFYAVDDEFRFTYVNERAEELLGHDEADLLGQTVWEALSVDDDDPIRDRFETAMATQTATSFERFSEPLGIWEIVRLYPSESGLSVYFTDITDRKERERELEESQRRYRTLVENFPNGAVALVDEDLRYVTFGGTPEGNTDVTRSDLEGKRLHDALPDQIAEVVIPRYEAALDGETAEFEDTIDGRTYEFHFLPVRDDSDDVFTAIAMSQEITEQKERERELERQREQLAALNNLNDVVHRITEAVLEQSTRDEIERAVCEHLAATDSYLFAWIGDVDVASQTVNLRAEAGVEGYLDGITISVDPDDERSMGPTGRAIQYREIQTTRDIVADSRHDPWRDHIEEYGFRSSAAIPIVHEDTVYGVLNVYAERPNAFEEQERSVIGRLGEVVGHAIAAAERKRALMSDEVVELEFRIRDVFDALGIDLETDGMITLDHTVPIEDDEYLQYGTATDDAVDSVAAIVDALPHWIDVTFRDDGEVQRFELRLSEPPVLSAVASLGGAVESAVIEDGDYRMTIHLTPGGGIRRVIDVVQTAYPAAELLKHRQITRRDTTADRVRNLLSEDLTDRQRATLEAAYHAGFFEWPRDTTGEDVADSLDIAPATFHQHLRRSQKKVFESLLSAPSST